MTEQLLIILTTLFINNIVLTQFLGLCPFLGVSTKLKTAASMGFATTFVLTLSAIAGFLINEYILVPYDLNYLRTLFFILIIASVVSFSEIVIRKSSQWLYRVLGIYLPLITSNCAVLGVALLNVQHQHDFISSVSYGVGSALGFTFVLVVFAGLRERIQAADIPLCFKGNPIALMSAGFMALAFMGLSGIGGT